MTNNSRRATFPIEMVHCEADIWAEHPDHAAPEPEVLHPLTDAEKVRIIHLQKSEDSWTTISSMLKRPLSTCRSFYEKWEQTEVFARTRGRPRRISRDVEDTILAKNREDRRSSVREVAHEMELSHESVRTIRHRNGFHYYDSTPIQSLQPLGKELKRKFCEGQLQRDDGLAIIFTDESTVAQDMNKGGIWRHKWKLPPDATYE